MHQTSHPLLQEKHDERPHHPCRRALRRLEARGLVRGGRFVSGLTGEQFAWPDAVDRLRRVRDSEPDGEEIELSATDPLNLTGVVIPGARIPAQSGRRIVVTDGRVTEREDQESIAS